MSQKTTEIKLSKILSEDRVVDLISMKKDNVLKELTQVLGLSKTVSNKLDAYKAITEREKIWTTAAGSGVAIPHARSAVFSDFVMAIGRKPEGIPYDSPDGEPVNLVVMLGAPEGRDQEFLKLISRLVLLFKNSKFRKKVISAKSGAEVLHSLKDR